MAVSASPLDNEFRVTCIDSVGELVKFTGDGAHDCVGEDEGESEEEKDWGGWCFGYSIGTA